jgi:thiol-disulfide isomerase/thioredoxin
MMRDQRVLALTAIVLFIVAGAIVAFKYHLRDSQQGDATAGDSLVPIATVKAPYENQTRVLSAARFLTVKGDTIPVSRYRGKWLLLNFWATWCGPCRMEMPDLDLIWRKQHKAGLEVLGVTNETPDVVMNFLKNPPPGARVTYPLAMDPASMVGQDLQITAIPRTLILNPKGEVVFDAEGAAGKEQFLDALQHAGFPLQK